jgi:hypothetical protein
MKTAYRKRLGVELLEQKQMLAGDVVVSMVHGALQIQGDATANHVAISSGAEGSLVIQGLDGTTVHMAGSTAPAPDTGLVVQNVKGDVRVSLGDGDDVVDLHDAMLRHDLTINTGAGADAVNVGVASGAAATAEDDAANVNVRGSVLIRTGSENDTVNLASANIRGVLGIATDGGDDTVTVGFETGDEASGAAAPPTDEDEPVALEARGGIDISLGDGADTATLTDVGARAQVIVGGGTGDDTLSLEDVKTALLALRGGDGDGADHVTLDGIHAKLATIELGGGVDDLSIVDSAFNALAVGLGSGNDTLSLASVQATRALLGGGQGDGDQFTDGGGNTLDHKIIAGFELPVDVNTGPLFPRIGGSHLAGGVLGGLINRHRR